MIKELETILATRGLGGQYLGSDAEVMCGTAGRLAECGGPDLD
jgi:hypothetical protein